jgi:hypothetical protein
MGFFHKPAAESFRERKSLLLHCMDCNPHFFVGPLSPEAEGFEEHIVDTLYDLADKGYPPPQALEQATL